MKENHRFYRTSIFYVNSRLDDMEFHKSIVHKVSHVAVKLDENGNFNESTAELSILEQLGLSKELKSYGAESVAYSVLWYPNLERFAVMRRFKYEKTSDSRSVILGSTVVMQSVDFELVKSRLKARGVVIKKLPVSKEILEDLYAEFLKEFMKQIKGDLK